jgi:hypothetical protein
VAWISKTDFIRVWDVVNHGALPVGRSFVVNTTTLLQERSYRQQKTTMMPFVVGMKRVF